jgi:hypothetical protein
VTPQILGLEALVAFCRTSELTYDARVANPRRAANAEGLAAIVNGALGAGGRASLYDMVRSTAS